MCASPIRVPLYRVRGSALLVMLRAVVSEQQDDWDYHLPAVLSAYRSLLPIATQDLVLIGWSIAEK